MTYMQPFLLLMGRAAVFWIGAAVFLGTSIVLVALGQPAEIITPYIDAAFLAAFGLPAVAGWLGGAVIQEFQNCTFAWPLPAANKRIAMGFLTTGVTVSLVVAGFVSLSRTNIHGFSILLALGIAGYCLCGDFFAPRSRWMGLLNLLLMVFLIARSRHLSALALAHPLPAIAISLALALFGIARLFSRSAFRHRTLRVISPFPGSYSLERSKRFQRGKVALEGPRRSGWRTGYLGVGTWSWVRAAFHEFYGPFGWQSIRKVIDRLWALGLLLVIYAWSDKGDLGFGEALGKTTYGVLFDSPHVPPFSEYGGRHPIVILVIAAAGTALALSSQAALGTSLAYPLSRLRLAKITYRAGLVDAAVFFVGIFALLSILGHLSGWLVGYPVRFDFVPFFIHPLLATVVLMPLAKWGGLQIQIATRHKTGDTLVAVLFVVIGVVAIVWVWTAVAPKILTSPLSLFTVSMILLLICQDFYRRKLRRYFAAADLV